MKRFIFLSFAFLAAAFYQMSGGADFEPRTVALQRATAIDVSQPQSPAEVPARSDQVQAASLIARPAAVQPAPPAQAEPTQVAFIVPTAPATAAPAAAPLTQPLVLASLDQGLAGLTAAAPIVPAPAPVAAIVPPADIREITATRVNMRDGPGTTFPILTRLSLGHEVEILDSPGNGWLRLRTLPEEQVGWISASLVSKASR